MLRQPELTLSMLYSLYGTALALSKSDDRLAQAILQIALNTFEATKLTTQGSRLAEEIPSRVHLAAVLRRLGEDKRAEQEYAGVSVTHRVQTKIVVVFREEAVIKHLRKYPLMYYQRELREFLMRDGEGASSPVLDALGGPSWITDRTSSTTAQKREVKRCRQCGKHDSEIKLFRCGRCQHILCA